MANRKVEEYAYKYDISNSEAKRRLGKRSRSESQGEGSQAPIRGVPVAGTGKPKGAKK